MRWLSVFPESWEWWPKMTLPENDHLDGITIMQSSEYFYEATEEGKKKVDGVAYNLPGKAQVTLMYNNKKLFDDQLPITQFGTVEYLAPVLFNKNSTIKVLFDTATGGLIKVDRE